MRKLKVVWENGDKTQYEVPDDYTLDGIAEKPSNSIVIFDRGENREKYLLLMLKTAREVGLQ